MKLLTRKCDGRCRMPGYHTHHLSPLGKWHFVYRYALWSTFVPDPRPQPVPAEEWFVEYATAWQQQYEGIAVRSSWVRDEKGYWVWVTDTPGFDRQWFDSQGWQFPARWIPAGAKDFYTVGHDDISTIVSIEPQEPEQV